MKKCGKYLCRQCARKQIHKAKQKRATGRVLRLHKYRKLCSRERESKKRRESDWRAKQAQADLCEKRTLCEYRKCALARAQAQNHHSMWLVSEVFIVTDYESFVIYKWRHYVHTYICLKICTHISCYLIKHFRIAKRRISYLRNVNRV